MGQRVIIERPDGAQFGVTIEAAREFYPDARVISNEDGSAYRPSPNLTTAGALAGELDNPQTIQADADIAAEADRLAAVAAQPVAEAPPAPKATKAAPEGAPAPDGA